MHSKTQWVDAELALPVYLRDDAWKKFQNKVKRIKVNYGSFIAI
jgi:S-adenosylmethionine:diacylglycerol 3-amino-3-carboxypropyl transferase